MTTQAELEEIDAAIEQHLTKLMESGLCPCCVAQSAISHGIDLALAAFGKGMTVEMLREALEEVKDIAPVVVQ